MDRVSAWRFISPPERLIKGLAITLGGKRVCNEDLYGATTAEHLAQQGGGKGWLLVDQALLDTAKAEARPGKLPWSLWLPVRLMMHTSSVKGNTLAELAAGCELDAKALQTVVDKYNAGCRREQDEFDKLDTYLRPPGEGPYYALDISIDNPKVPYLDAVGRRRACVLSLTSVVCRWRIVFTPGVGLGGIPRRSAHQSRARLYPRSASRVQTRQALTPPMC